MSSVSPSVYIGFQELNVTDLCGQYGTVISKTTLGFKPEDLSTSIALVDVGFKDFSIIGIHASYDYTWSRFTYSFTSNIGVNVQRRRVLSLLS